MKILALTIISILSFTCYSQEIVQEKHPLYASILKHSIKQNDFDKGEKGRFSIVLLSDSASLVSNKFSGVKKGLYTYRITGSHVRDHLFIVSEEKVKFLKYYNDTSLRKFLKPLISECDLNQTTTNRLNCMTIYMEQIRAWEAEYIRTTKSTSQQTKNISN